METSQKFREGDMVVALIGGVPCSGLVSSVEVIGSSVVAYMVDITVFNGDPPVRVPVEHIRDYW